MSAARVIFAVVAVAAILFGGALAADAQLQAGDSPSVEEESFADILGGGLQVSQVVLFFLAVVAVLSAIGVLSSVS